VSSTAQIEAKVDVVRDGREQSRSGKTLRNPKNSEQEKEQRADDEDEFPEILGHKKISFEFLVSSFENSASRYTRNLKHDT
jgi:hypothetical protein